MSEYLQRILAVGTVLVVGSTHADTKSSSPEPISKLDDKQSLDVSHGVVNQNDSLQGILSFKKSPPTVEHMISTFQLDQHVPGVTPTATAEKIHNLNYTVRYKASTESQDFGKINSFFPDGRFQVSGKVNDGQYDWYRIANLDDEYKWIRSDGVNLIPNEQGEIPQIVDLTPSYNLAISMNVYDKRGNQITGLTGYDVLDLDDLDDLVRQATTNRDNPYPIENFQNGTLDIYQSNQQNFFYKLRETSAGNPAGSIYTLISRENSNPLLVFLPTNVIEEALANNNFPIDVNILPTNDSNIFQINSRVIFDMDAYLNGATIEDSLFIVEEEVEPQPTTIWGSAKTLATPGLEITKFVTQQGIEMAQNNPYIYLNDGTPVRSGCLAEIQYNGQLYLLCAGKKLTSLSHTGAGGTGSYASFSILRSDGNFNVIIAKSYFDDNNPGNFSIELQNSANLLDVIQQENPQLLDVFTNIESQTIHEHAVELRDIPDYASVLFLVKRNDETYPDMYQDLKNEVPFQNPNPNGVSFHPYPPEIIIVQDKTHNN